MIWLILSLLVGLSYACDPICEIGEICTNMWGRMKSGTAFSEPLGLMMNPKRVADNVFVVGELAGNYFKMVTFDRDFNLIHSKYISSDTVNSLDALTVPKYNSASKQQPSTYVPCDGNNDYCAGDFSCTAGVAELGSGYCDPAGSASVDDGIRFGSTTFAECKIKCDQESDCNMFAWHRNDDCMLSLEGDSDPCLTTKENSGDDYNWMRYGVGITCKTAVENVNHQYCVTDDFFPYEQDTSLTATEAIEKCTSACRIYAGFTVGVASNMDACQCRPYTHASCPNTADQRTLNSPDYGVYDYTECVGGVECPVGKFLNFEDICMTMKDMTGPNAHSSGCDSARSQDNDPEEQYCKGTAVNMNSSSSYYNSELDDDKEFYQTCCDWTGDACIPKVKTISDCKSCSTGRYSDEVGLVSDDQCKQCPSGTYQDENARTQLSDCKQCPSGEYGDELGANDCKVCPAGYESDSGASSCSEVCVENEYGVSEWSLFEEGSFCDADVNYITSSSSASVEVCQQRCDSQPNCHYISQSQNVWCMTHETCDVRGYSDTYKIYLKPDICHDCPLGYESTARSTSCVEKDDCAHAACGNGKCIDGMNSYTCECYPGWTKDNDLTCSVDINYCTETSCKTETPDAKCIEKNTTFSCNCTGTDYSGSDCTVWNNNCLGVDCGNGGCTDLLNDYICDCNDGTTGSYCEYPPHPCDNVECGSYGSCSEGSCICSYGYSGSSCGTPPDPCFYPTEVNCGVHGTCSGGSCNCDPGYSGTPCADINECSPNPCQNGATCTNLENDYNCQCQPGYEGDNCETDVNECEGQSCGNGICVDLVADFRCDCFSGWVTTSGYCDTNENNCLGVNCGNGNCTDGNNTYSCTCDTGYVGNHCEENFDDCNGIDCSGNGFCTDGLADYTCTCNSGWYGKDCQTNVNYCDDVDCGNGDCVDGLTDYTCNCNTGWTTDSSGKCSADVDECASSPCKNGGSCTDFLGYFVCDCATGWEGDTCLENPDDCTDKVCTPGVCVDGLGDYSCDCSGTGFEGDHCELNVNDCLLGSCNSHGECNDKVNGFECNCHGGWEGDNCESSVDDCTGTPCSGHGACVDGHKGYTCNCDAGFTGDICDYNVDECSGVDCGQGTCRDIINGYECDCTPGWAKVGGKCFENIDDCAGKDCGDGICQDGVNEHICKCSPGFTTDTSGSCTVDIDECATNPCENGNCTDGIAVFTCACDEGWYGQLCDQNCLVDADCGYKCSEGKCVTYSFFTDFKFYLVGIWCIIAVTLLFCASLKSVNKSVAEFTKSVPEIEERQMYW